MRLVGVVWFKELVPSWNRSRSKVLSFSKCIFFFPLHRREDRHIYRRYPQNSATQTKTFYMNKQHFTGKGKMCTFRGCTVPLTCNASSLLRPILTVSSLIKEQIFCIDFRSLREQYNRKREKSETNNFFVYQNVFPVIRTCHIHLVSTSCLGQLL